MKHLVALLCLVGLCLLPVAAQNEPEYRLELGVGAGLTAYTGDFNGSLMRGMQPLGEVVAKYKMNPRMALGAALGISQLKGSSTNADTWYPGLAVTPVDFKTSLIDFNVRYEYNFWPFGTGEEYRGAQPLTPFIAIGMGLSFAKPEGQTTKTGFQVPIGLGVKYKLAQRWNLAAEWMIHFTGSDQLDGVSDPYGIKSSGLFKNTDCYGVAAVTLTYDLWEKCKTCNNDRD